MLNNYSFNLRSLSEEGSTRSLSEEGSTRSLSEESSTRSLSEEGKTKNQNNSQLNVRNSMFATLNSKIASLTAEGRSEANSKFFILNSKFSTLHSSLSTLNSTLLALALFLSLGITNVFGQVENQKPNENHNSRIKNMAPLKPQMSINKTQNTNNEIQKNNDSEGDQLISSTSSEKKTELSAVNREELFKYTSEIYKIVNSSHEKQLVYDKIKNQYLGDKTVKNRFIKFHQILYSESIIKSFENLSNDDLVELNSLINNVFIDINN